MFALVNGRSDLLSVIKRIDLYEISLCIYIVCMCSVDRRSML